MVDQNLGELVTVTIDPTWPHRQAFLGAQGNDIGQQLRFTYIDLESGIGEQTQANYADNEVVGRAETYKSFVGTSNRVFSLNFRFFAQGELGAPRVRGGQLSTTQAIRASESEVVRPARWLDALQYPVYDSSQQRSFAPPPVILRVGQLIAARCIVTSAQIQWLGPWETDTMLPYYAEVPVEFTVVRRLDSNPGYSFAGSWQ